MQARSYQASAEGADSKDAGGYFRFIDVPDLTPELKNRMRRCTGCHQNFYNHRQNVDGNCCWSLKSNANFERKGRPACYED